MEVALIAPYSDVTSYGVRTLVSIIRDEGHSVTLIILNDPVSETVPHLNQRYPSGILDEIYSIVSTADLVGFSLMTLYYDRIVQLTSFLKNNISVPLIWGGMHPTIKPEESLQWADGVALGEADRSLPQLLSNLQSDSDMTKTPGFWFKKNDSILRNTLIEPVTDLDELPFPDYFPEKQYILDQHKKHLVEVDSGVLKKAFEHNPIWKMGQHVYYQTMATRGCPHNCAYCCNSALRKLYNSNWKVRYRSPDHLVEELKLAREQFSYITAIVFSDDSFFSYSIEQIKEYARLYKEAINLPFRCLTSPLTLSREKLEILLECGLFSLQMGIQTGSEKIKKMYRRKISDEKILSATRLINEYNERMDPPLYDFILDNPEETVEDCLQTLNLVKQIPRPYFLQLFSLVLFPGTELFDVMITSHGDINKQGYQHPFSAFQATYCNIVMLLFHYGVSLRIMRLLTYEPLVNIMSKSPFKFLVKYSFRFWKKLKSVHSP